MGKFVRDMENIMKYMKAKNIVVLLMIHLVIFSMLGCNNIKENQTGSGEAYVEQLVISDWMQDKMNRVSFRDDVVYFTTYGEIVSDTGEHYCNNRLYCVNRDGSDLKEIPMDLTKENPLTMITSIMVNEDNTISIWLSSYDPVEADQVNVFITVDDTGKELVRKDLNALVNEQYVGKAFVIPQGQIAAMAENKVYIFDESLELVNEIDIEGHAIGVAYMKENQIVCATEDNNAKKKFQVIDIEQAKVVDTISLSRGEVLNENTLFDCSQYDLCYRNDKGIYSYDIKSKKSTCLLDYEKSNLISEDIVDGISVEADDFIIIDYSHDGTGSSIALYTKADTSVENSKTIITFGAFQFDDNMKRAVQDFNKTNATYQITLKEYFDVENQEMSADKAIEELNKDIVKGAVPDILDLSMLTEEYASKGLFEDLIPYIEKDAELSEEIFVGSLFDTMKQEGKLYYITPDFSMTTLLGSVEYKEECAGWDTKKLIALCEKQEDAIPFYVETKIDLLDILLQGSLGEFYSWENEECQFDSQEFKDILTFCDLAIRDEDSLEASLTREEMIRQGKVLWMDESDFVPQEIAYYSKLFGGEISYIGYPNQEGNGSYFSINTRIGICSESEVKDGAWEFICMLLSYEYQEQYADLHKGMNRIPVRRDCFELLMTRLSNPQEDIEGINPNISCIQEKDFRNLVENTHKVVSYDIEVMKIIEEEAQAYFLGKKDMDETVRNIQNRCVTYMNEKR